MKAEFRPGQPDRARVNRLTIAGVKTNAPILLARYLALAWTGLLIYGSLHPFSGWRDTGVPPLDFLEAAWPRYWTGFDLTTNVLAYLPFGFLLALGLFRLPGRYTALLVTLFAGTLLSFTMELIQNWLPSRVPSNLDLACNSLGTLLGALLALRAGPRFFPHLTLWLHRLVAPLPHAELGLTLLGLWLLIPLSPEILLFGAGDLRQTLDLPSALPFSAVHFTRAEAGVVACNTVAIGLLVRLLAANVRLAYPLVAGILLIGLWVRTMSAAVLVNPAQSLAWWTPGVQSGLLIGGLVLSIALLLPAILRQSLAAIALMSGTVLVNIAPHNPYSLAALAVWQQGHFLNFNGMTHLVSILWPFMALPYFMLGNRAPDSD